MSKLDPVEEFNIYMLPICNLVLLTLATNKVQIAISTKNQIWIFVTKIAVRKNSSSVREKLL